MAKNGTDKQIDDILTSLREEIIKKTEKALEKARIRILNEINKIIKEYMIDDYYIGYEPISYHRTYQLPCTVGPYAPLERTETGFKFIDIAIDEDPPKYGFARMDHAEKTVTVSWKTKNGQKKTKTYTYNLPYSLAREEVIYENFWAGIHPKVGRVGTHHIESRTRKALDYFVDFKAQQIINEEIDKIKL